MGESVAYTAVNNGSPYPLSYNWEYKYTSGSCQGNWVNGGTSQTVYFIEHRPGTWSVRLTATYYPPTQPTVITKSVTIAPATHFTIVEGTDTSTAFSSSIVLKFRVDAAGRPCGSYISGNLAQEQATEWWNLSPPYQDEYPPDTDWSPEGPIDAFHLAGNQIWDTHSNGLNSSGWATIPSSDNFLTVKQWLRIRYVDPCNETKYINLGSHVVTWTKVDADNWKITAFTP